jgi:hypothetical protein
MPRVYIKKTAHECAYHNCKRMCYKQFCYVHNPRKMEHRRQHANEIYQQKKIIDDH